jgi:hypothetical protein
LTFIEVAPRLRQELDRREDLAQLIEFAALVDASGADCAVLLNDV